MRYLDGDDKGAAFGDRVVLHAHGKTASVGRDPATHWLLLRAGLIVAVCERRADHDLHKAAALELGRFGELEEI